MNSNLAIHSRSCRKLFLYSCFTALALLILSSIKFPQGVRHITGVSDMELNGDTLLGEADRDAVRTHITVAAGSSTDDGNGQRIAEMEWKRMRIRSGSDWATGRKLLSEAAAAGNASEEGGGSIKEGESMKWGRKRRRRRRRGIFVKAQQQQKFNEEKEMNSKQKPPEDVDESASFHVDYSGPKTHPPKNN